MTTSTPFLVRGIVARARCPAMEFQSPQNGFPGFLSPRQKIASKSASNGFQVMEMSLAVP
ncbi:hypothetical protein [Streptomyces sp. BH105]|uniref:hypothetical protein n=1 Tax=Streptomyces sp. BH105 TaxID=3410408 RepID=UPI003CFA8C19